MDLGDITNDEAIEIINKRNEFKYEKLTQEFLHEWYKKQPINRDIVEIAKILKNNGIFEYKNNGFYIKQGNTIDFVKWIDVESISHFELKMLKKVSQNGIEIVTNKKIYKIHNNDEQTIGLEKFENEVNKNLSIEKLYDSEVLSDGSSKTLLYLKTLN